MEEAWKKKKKKKEEEEEEDKWKDIVTPIFNGKILRWVTTVDGVNHM